MFLTKLIAWLNTFLTGYVSTVVGGLTVGLVALAYLMMLIYLVNYGVSVTRGDVSEPIDVLAWKGMKLGFITTFALTSGIYMGMVHKGLDDLQNGMATMFISSGAGMGEAKDTTTAFQALDKAYEDADVRLKDIRAEADIVDDWDLIVADVVFTFGLWIFLIVAAAVTLMSKVFLAFAMTLGPIAILCLMFEKTSKFFDGWLSFALSAVVTTWFAFFALGLGLFVLDEIVKDLVIKGAFNPETEDLAGMTTPLSGAGAFLCMSVLMAIMLMQAPKLAAALTGGAAMSTGAIGAASFITGRMSGGGKGGGNSNNGSGGSGGGNSVGKGGGAAYSAGKAGGYAFQRVSSLMSRRR